MKNRFRITYKRGHGPGGQHKNKVETCVVVVDPETGFSETCQDTRSRARNEKIAIYRLQVRITAASMDEEDRKRNDLRKEQIKPGKAIRTYNFARDEVVDHRTGKKANLKKVLNGNLNLLK
jgi:peptide chain release factor 1